MDPQQQMMLDALSGGMPSYQGPQPTDPSSVKGLSPEALSALFLTPGTTMRLDEKKNMLTSSKTIPGESGRYDIVHDKAGRVGNAILTYEPHRKTVVVDYMSSPKSLNPAVENKDFVNHLGTTEIRSLLKSLGKTFPEAENVEGLRISGARRGSAASSVRPDSWVGNQPTVKIPRSQGLSGMPGTKLTDFW